MESLDSTCLDEMLALLKKYSSGEGDYWVGLVEDLFDIDTDSDKFLSRASSDSIWAALLDVYFCESAIKYSENESRDDERKFRNSMARLGDYLIQFEERTSVSDKVGKIANKSRIRGEIQRWRAEGLV